MKVVVIGLGSMGRRRIRLLRQYDDTLTIIGVDLNSDNQKIVQQQWGIDVYGSLQEAIDYNSIDCAIISTSPLSHASIITACLSNGIHVFTELNLVDTDYDLNMSLAKEKGRVLFLSSTFLYRPEIEFIKAKVDGCGEKINYTYHVGQYLPDWHPWESYKDFFVGDRRTNGCREIFAIELPWIINTFGKIKRISTIVRDKVTNLEIEYNDTYMIILEHENGHKGTLCVDVVSRKAVRNLEIYSENLYLHWNGSPKGLFNYNFETKQENQILLYNEVDQLNDYSEFIVENAYYNEIVDYFKTINDKSTPRYSFEKDKDVLEIIDIIEGYEKV